jgi:TRAP-type C4-dicarboxylate transport system permease small subunit
MKRLLSSLERIEALFSGIAMAIMAAVMCIVVTDVVCRYAFNSPLAWTFDFSSLYLMAGMFYFVLPRAYARRDLISIDVLYDRLPARGKFLCGLVTRLTSGAFFLLVAYAGALRSVDEYRTDSVVSGMIAWPTWPSSAIVVIGSALLVVRVVIELIDCALQPSGSAGSLATDAQYEHVALH